MGYLQGGMCPIPPGLVTVLEQLLVHSRVGGTLTAEGALFLSLPHPPPAPLFLAHKQGVDVAV